MITDLIHFHEMISESVKYAAVSHREDVLDPVAIIAEGLESHQPLVSSALVVVPDLVAVEPRIPSADLASIPGALVYTPPDSVPLGPGQELSQTGHC